MLNFDNSFPESDTFNSFLNNLLKSTPDAFYRTYVTDPEPLSEEEKEEWGDEDIRVVCFRIPGYTIGHLIVKRLGPYKFEIKKVVVYERETVNAFKLSCKELEKVLTENFVGKEL